MKEKVKLSNSSPVGDWSNLTIECPGGGCGFLTALLSSPNTLSTVTTAWGWDGQRSPTAALSLSEKRLI